MCQRSAQGGPACAQLIDTLLADRILERLRAAQGLLRLATTYPAQHVELACQRALDHGSPYYRTVKTLLTVRPELLRDTPTPLTGGVYLDAARFARPASFLFCKPANSDPDSPL